MNEVLRKYRIFLVCLVLASATLVVFLPVGNYEFLNFDDSRYIVENQHVRDGFSVESIKWAFTIGNYSYWHPLVWLSHMLDCQLFGLDAGRHHLVNLLFHIINVLLLFTILRRMTGAVWRSAFVAAMFALHPIHVESVAWITERKDVLSTFFWMLTVVGYLQYIRCRQLIWYLFMLAVFTVGLLAKPILVTLPFVMLLLDYWPLGRFQANRIDNDSGREKHETSHNRPRWRLYFHLVYEKIPLFAFAFLSSYLSSLSVRRLGIMVLTARVPMTLRIANALVSYVSYIAKMVWPRKLAIFYPYPDAVPMWQAAAALLLLAVVSAAVVWAAKKRGYLVVGWLWYLGVLIPVSGLVQVGAWPALADRFVYIPFIGLYIIIAWGGSELLGKLRFPKIAFGTVMFAIILVLSVCTRLQVRYWQNSRILFEQAVNVTEDNYLAHYHLAQSLSEEGEIDKTIIHLREVIRLRPYRKNILNLLAWYLSAYKESNFHNPKEAVKITECICRVSNYKDANFLATLSVAYAASGNFLEAIKAAENALELVRNSDQKVTEQTIQEYLRLYKLGQPYFEVPAESFSSEADATAHRQSQQLP